MPYQSLLTIQQVSQSRVTNHPDSPSFLPLFYLSIMIRYRGIKLRHYPSWRTGGRITRAVEKLGQAITLGKFINTKRFKRTKSANTLGEYNMPSHLEQCRYNMVEQQVRPWDVLDNKVLDTLEQIPRDQYVPTQYTNLAYADTAIPLNDTQSMMHPVIEGRLLQLLDIQAKDNILEIGTGSGYLTACLAHLGNHVDSVEIDETLANKAAQTLLEQGIFNISLSCANGLELPDSRQQYNVIVLTGSVSEVPGVFKNALAINGRLFVVDGKAPAMQAHLITRKSETEWVDTCVFETVLQPLLHGEPAPVFQF